ncbi:MAG TPA: hypothetical protein VHF89_17645 [Solirubrobacteraceae bacterium]|nr:hypothetical protein [Solirubrobacteraceae bacterium]
MRAIRSVLVHPLLWVVLLAGAAFGLGYLAFSAERGWVQVTAGVLAGISGLLYMWAWWKWEDRPRTGFWHGAWGIVLALLSAPFRALLRVAGAVAAWVRKGLPLPDRATWARFGRFVVLVLTSAAAFVGGLIGAAVVLGRLIADDRQPLALGWMYVGLAVVGTGALLLVTWWARTFARVVRGREPSFWFNVVVGSVVLVAGLAWMSARDTPGEVQREVEQARQAGAGRFDLLLVVDPGDAAGQTLIRAAQRAVARGEPDALFASSPAGGRYDVAIGIAVPQPRAGDRPLWRLVEPPSTDHVEVATALAEIRPRSGAPSTGSYGRLLVDTLIEGRAHWRPSSQLGVAFLLERLPTLSQLDAHGGGAAPDVERCPAEGAVDPPDDAAMPVPWSEAIAMHCRRRAAYKSWEQEGRPEPEPPRPVAVHALTSRAEDERGKVWRAWIRALDGSFHRPDATADVDAAGERMLRAAADLHTGLPVGDLANLTRWFRPHLFFDGAERFLPIDADWLLRHPPPPDDEGEEPPRHLVCDHEAFEDNCDTVKDSTSLVGSLDEYVDFAGGVRFGLDLERREDAPARMYVHVRRSGDRLFLGYWWYLEYNVSPWKTEVNCLPGLTFKELSCHDHEGDWEGVTVELRVLDPSELVDEYALRNVEPVAVVYAAHSARVRWRWEDVELAADRGARATHPVVYVAAGSHAAYPARCRQSDCTQELAGTGIPEGGFDGGQPWPPNDAATCSPRAKPDERVAPPPCLVALPATRDGALGLLWNAFPGRWGRARCTVLAKVCSQVDGPRSPSRQTRFRDPSSATEGDVALLRARRQEEGMQVGMDVPRWPPPEGEPVGATPALR